MTALFLLLVVWLPGAVLFRIPRWSRERRAALPADERLFWTVVLSVSWSLVVVLALAAAHRYSLIRLALVNGAASVVPILWWRSRLGFGGTATRPGPLVLLPLALIAVSAYRFTPASEYVIGGKDPGVYVNEGVQIAQRGALVYRDPVLTAIPPFARDLFIPDYQHAQYYSIRFMGFFVQQPDLGTVIGQFPHLFPASIAVGYGLFGLTGARYAVVVWAMLGVLAVYFLGARFIGRPAAAVGALLLTLNVVEVWFARYPNTEVVMQALLFAALLANARAHVDGDSFFAPIAGAILGLLLFLRFDAVIAIAAVVGSLAVGVAASQRPRWTFWPPLLAAIALNFWYLTGPMRAYAELPFGFISHLYWWHYLALAAGAAAVVSTAFAAGRRPLVAAAVSRWLPVLLNCVILVLTLYAMVLRHPGGRLTTYDADALRTFTAFYLTLPALLAALIGYLLIARGLFWRDSAFILTLSGFAVFFFYKIKIVPVHFWMARRFLSMVLPGMLLLVAAAALTGVRGRWPLTRAIRGPIGIVFLALLAASYARASRPVAEHVEYAGIIPRLERLAGAIGPDDLLVVESRNASDVHVLALPLAYIYDRKAVVLANPNPDKATFAAWLDRARLTYRRVLFLGGGGSDLLSPRWAVAPLASDRFQVPEYDAPLEAYPRFAREKEFDYSLYEFLPPSADDRPFDLDIGVNDDLNVLRFNAKETTEGRTIRWTRARSFLSITRLHDHERTLTLWLSNGGRPAAAPDAQVTVRIGDTFLGTAVVSAPGFHPYTFTLPAAVVRTASASGEPVRVTLETVTWNPLRVLGTSDDRDLGVMVDRAAVQ